MNKGTENLAKTAKRALVTTWALQHTQGELSELTHARNSYNICSTDGCYTQEKLNTLTKPKAQENSDVPLESDSYAMIFISHSPLRPSMCKQRSFFQHTYTMSEWALLEVQLRSRVSSQIQFKSEGIELLAKDFAVSYARNEGITSNAKCNFRSEGAKWSEKVNVEKRQTTSLPTINFTTSLLPTPSAGYRAKWVFFSGSNCTSSFHETDSLIVTLLDTLSPHHLERIKSLSAVKSEWGNNKAIQYQEAINEERSFPRRFSSQAS